LGEQQYVGAVLCSRPREFLVRVFLEGVGQRPAGDDAKVNITVREHLVFPLAERPVLREYEEFTDVPRID
jgi:hypothetical protein